jgi:hypothetical protein
VSCDLKQVPPTIRWLGLHALLLLLPLLPDRASESEEASDPEETQVTLAPLPIEPVPSPSTAPPPAVPSPAPSASVSPPAAPAQVISPAVNPVPTPQPAVTVKPNPVVSPSTETADPSPVSPAPLPPPNQIVLPFADFPHLADGASCANQASDRCRQVSGNFRQVSETLREQLRSQGYTVSSREDLGDTGQQVYEVSKDGTSRYLSILSSDLGGTAYVLAAEPVTPADLEQVGAVQTDLETALSQLAGGAVATSAQFTYPEFFFNTNQPRSDIVGLHTVSGRTPAQLGDRLTRQLQPNGFQLVPVGDYGGGPVYEVSRQSFISYLNLVPTADSSGTIVVQWQRLPQ